MATVIETKSQTLRMSAVDRKQQIVRVAAELFSQKGFKGTTTKEIAERAGVSEAIIFRHFPTKDVLYSAIIDYKTRQSSEQIEAHLQEAANRKDDLAYFGTLAYEFLEVHQKDPTIMRLLMFSALEGHQLSEMFFQSTARRVRDHVLRYIKQRIADGAFREVDARVCSRAFMGMILFHSQVRNIYKDTSCDDLKMSNRQIAERFVNLFLGGIAKEGK
jgi:TetR/AcrR family transcriptional regulator